MRRALWPLCRFGGDLDVEAYYPMVLATQDLEELERQRIRRHVFLARYGKQSMLQWDDVEASKVRAYARALAELLKEEDDEVKKATAAVASKG